ncbi:MAG: hypothetical protein ACI9JN_002988 [Bacteroidia bacterium]|jgi:hypothetical protein
MLLCPYLYVIGQFRKRNPVFSDSDFYKNITPLERKHIKIKAVEMKYFIVQFLRLT